MDFRKKLDVTAELNIIRLYGLNFSEKFVWNLSFFFSSQVYSHEMWWFSSYHLKKNKQTMKLLTAANSCLALSALFCDSNLFCVHNNVS